MELKERIDCCHTRRVLEENGITTLEELALLEREDLLKMRGIGKVIAGDLEQVIAQYKREKQEETT